MQQRIMAPIRQGHSGAGHLLAGFRLLSHPRLRAFVLVPFLVNLLLFGLAFYWLISQIGGMVDASQQWLPYWLEWLAFLLWPLLLLTLLLAGVFGFTTLTNLIAAPFNGLLAERTEQLLTGKPLVSDVPLWQEVPRAFYREWLKIRYFIPRALACLVLSFIPGFGPLVAPFAWFVLNAWMMGIQFCDYPFDNHKVSFPTMRVALARQRTEVFSFGALYNLLAMVPLLNMILIPTAVCGATSLWVENYREGYGSNPE